LVMVQQNLGCRLPDAKPACPVPHSLL
jgi:hypothetical protein